MPSTLRYNRKAIVYILVVVGIFCYFAFYDSGASAQSFRTSTEAGLARARGQKVHHDTKTPLQENLSDEDQTKKAREKLQGILDAKNKENIPLDNIGEPQHRTPTEADIERDFGMTRENPRRKDEKQKDKTLDKTLDKPQQRPASWPGTEKFQHDVEDVSVAGRKQMPDPKYPKVADGQEKSMKTGAETDIKAEGKDVEKDKTEQVDPAKDFAREKLMEYLRNPVVIFSKSTCPHSKRAKHLLLDIYSITPKPLVVELDRLHDPVPSSGLKLGRVMQDVLGGMTGRKTVPNILVGGVHSIGGNDKIWDLHEKGLLAEEIRKLGGRKVTEVDVVADE